MSVVLSFLDKNEVRSCQRMRDAYLEVPLPKE